MTRGRTGRSVLAALLTALLCAVLAGCTGSNSEPEQSVRSEGPGVSPGPPPATLDAKWSIEGLNANPEYVGENHWATYQSAVSGIGRYGRSVNQGPLLLVDTRTGKARQRTPEDARWPCLLPSRLSDSGLVPVLWAHRSNVNGFDLVESEPCTRITVHDATTGKLAWRANDLDLSGLGRRRALGASDTVVAVVDGKGDRACFGARDGEARPDDHPDCLALHDRLSHSDHPELLDADGAPAPVSPAWLDEHDPDVVELGRTDQVLLVRAQNHFVVGGGTREYRWMVRAHDLETGETLWQDDDLTPDPYVDDTWARSETYFVAPSGVVRVSYEHPDDRDDASETPMVLTAVDPRTGEDLDPIARVDGAWFNHQFGAMTVALTDQEQGLRSRISGFELPTW